MLISASGAPRRAASDETQSEPALEAAGGARVDMAPVSGWTVPFAWALLNTEERLKSATMRKYEAQAAAVCSVRPFVEGRHGSSDLVSVPPAGFVFQSDVISSVVCFAFSVAREGVRVSVRVMVRVILRALLQLIIAPPLKLLSTPTPRARLQSSEHLLAAPPAPPGGARASLGFIHRSIWQEFAPGSLPLERVCLGSCQFPLCLLPFSSATLSSAVKDPIEPTWIKSNSDAHLNSLESPLILFTRSFSLQRVNKLSKIQFQFKSAGQDKQKIQFTRGMKIVAQRFERFPVLLTFDMLAFVMANKS